MTLYEATNGYMGESYLRCYVWAPDEAAALALASESFGSELAWRLAYKHGDLTANIRLRRLLGSDDPPFVTVVSDTGFNDHGL